MEKLMTKEESYAERRKLFKNIWATAMHMDEKETDIMSKPKVIKTLRLDEVDRTNIGKSKKQKIKNLRNVCNRLLDFCDRQDADDVFYEQMAAEAREKPEQKLNENESKPKKTKTKRKMKKAKSNAQGGDRMHPKKVTSGGKAGSRSHQETEISRVTSPTRIKRPTVVKRTTIVANKNLNPRASPERSFAPNKPQVKEVTSNRKVLKKKVSIKKKHSIMPVGKTHVNEVLEKKDT